SRVKLLGYALLMLLFRCCLLSIHSVYRESFFTTYLTFQTASKGALTSNRKLITQSRLAAGAIWQV
ncbi:MAG: hypothetical protein KME40_25330, partial [Komarekiella atlantica HA4396-MV6]|nr:hypothetical protein [Komarekiella atlantica HA4396-MV6]